MVLWLKPWESRSLPGLPRTRKSLFTCHEYRNAVSPREAAFLFVLNSRSCGIFGILESVEG